MLKDAAPLPFRNYDEIGEDEINPYWYGHLRGNDAEFLRGYDYNTIEVVNNLFDNIDVYAEQLERIGLDADDIDDSIVDGTISELNFNLPQRNNEDESKWFSDYTDEELKGMSLTTKFFLLVKEILNDHIESERDMLVTSMIDNMDEYPDHNGK